MTAPVDKSEKVREVRLRRTAKRQELKLSRSRRRDTRAVDYGRYYLTDTHTTAQVTYGTLDEIEQYLDRASRA